MGRTFRAKVRRSKRNKKKRNKKKRRVKRREARKGRSWTKMRREAILNQSRQMRERKLKRQ